MKNKRHPRSSRCYAIPVDGSAPPSLPARHAPVVASASEPSWIGPRPVRDVVVNPGLTSALRLPDRVYYVAAPADSRGDEPPEAILALPESVAPRASAPTPQSGRYALAIDHAPPEFVEYLVAEYDEEE